LKRTGNARPRGKHSPSKTPAIQGRYFILVRFGCLVCFFKNSLQPPAIAPNDQKRLVATHHGIRQNRRHRLQRQVFLTTQSTGTNGRRFRRAVVADGPTQNRVPRLESVEHRAQWSPARQSSSSTSPLTRARGLRRWNGRTTRIIAGSGLQRNKTGRQIAARSDSRKSPLSAEQ